MAIKRTTKDSSRLSPTGGARIRKVNGDTYVQLSSTAFDPVAEAAKPEDQQRKVNQTTGYFGTKVTDLGD